MKKLLVLALMLGLTTIADASIYLTNPPEMWLQPSDIINISVQYGNDRPDGIGDIGIIQISGPGVFTGGYKWYPLPPENSPIPWPPIYIEPQFAFFDSLSPTTSIPEAYQLVDLEFHCEGLGDVFIDLIDGNTGDILGTLLIHQIPEPATIAMLGLGGLAILRRRK